MTVGTKSPKRSLDAIRRKRAKDHRNARLRMRQELIEYKTRTPCTDCGLNFPHFVMEFDHIDGSGPLTRRLRSKGKHANRTSGPHRAISGPFNTRASMYKAMIGCELVCANCHKARTWRRQHEDRNT